MSRERVLSKWPHTSHAHPREAPPTPLQWRPPPVRVCPPSPRSVTCDRMLPHVTCVSVDEPFPIQPELVLFNDIFRFLGDIPAEVQCLWALGCDVWWGDTLRDSSGGSGDYLRAWKLNSNLLSSSTRNPDQWKCRFCFTALPSGPAYH